MSNKNDEHKAFWLIKEFSFNDIKFFNKKNLISAIANDVVKKYLNLKSANPNIHDRLQSIPLTCGLL